MKVVGITGGIATGKSTVKQAIIKQGYQIIDCDEIVHQLLEKTTVINEIGKLFGSDVISEGKVNRPKLGQIIFNDKQEQLRLNNLIHPLVIEEIKKKLNTLNENLVFIDIPLLFEAHLEYLVDKIIVVYVNESLQVKRLMKRDNISYEFALLKIKSQMPIDDKAKLADYIINNEKDIDNTITQLNEIIRRIKNEV